MKTLINLLVICCLSISFQAVSADNQGKFAVKGAGKHACKDFTKAANARTTDYYLFGGWVEGFISSYNQFQPENFDITPWQTTELILTLLKTHCAKNPDTRFLSATNSLIKTLFPIRLNENSNLMSVQVGKSKSYFYQEIITRVKSRLKAMGYLSGNINSTFKQEDAIALEKFQRKIGLTPTGMLDQQTLASLFLKSTPQKKN
jgi:hypothetical protein